MYSVAIKAWTNTVSHMRRDSYSCALAIPFLGPLPLSLQFVYNCIEKESVYCPTLFTHSTPASAKQKALIVRRP